MQKLKHTELDFPEWLKATAAEIKKSRKHQNLYIPSKVAREVYNQDCHPVAGATLILRILKPESNLENCLYLNPPVQKFGDLIYHN